MFRNNVEQIINKETLKYFIKYFLVFFFIYSLAKPVWDIVNNSYGLIVTNVLITVPIAFLTSNIMNKKHKFTSKY